MQDTVDQSYLREDIPEYKKREDAYFKSHLAWAERLILSYQPNQQRMTRMLDGYNGIRDPLSLEWITKTFGQFNKAPFIPWHLPRSKVGTLTGEQLKRPLTAKARTINRDAVINRMQQYDFLKGAMLAKKEIEAVRDKAGVDIMEGMAIPENESVFESMNFKNKYEDMAQIIIDQQIANLDLKKFTNDCFLFNVLTSHTWAKVELDQNGKVGTHIYDPRYAVYVPIEGDDYMEKSPIRGGLRWLPVTEILLRYNLTKDQRDKLNAVRLNPQPYLDVNGVGRGYFKMQGTELLVAELHIEWDSVTFEASIRRKKTNNQYENDPTDVLMNPADITDEYQKDPDLWKKRSEKEGSEITTKFRKDVYEATRLGGLIDVNMRKVPVKRSVDDPTNILSSTYVGFVSGRVNGTTISIWQLMENYGALYDLVKYQQNRELAKMKGKFVAIDRAGLGPQEKLGDVWYKLANEQLFDWDSAAAGNVNGRFDPKNMFWQGDLGLTESYQQLLVVEQNIIASLDRITGINDSRQGVTAASSTATAQQSDIANSRVITEALFYGFSGFTKRLMKAVLNKSILSYAFYQKEEGEQVLGSERYGFLTAPVTLAYQDYDLDIEDGTKYLEISEKVDRMMEVSLNAKEIRMQDALKVYTAETLAQKIAWLERGWAEMQKRIMESQAQAEQAQAQMSQQQLATQVQIATENREDLQNSEKEKIVLKGQVDIEKDNNRARNEAMLQQQEAQTDIILQAGQNKLDNG